MKITFAGVGSAFTDCRYYQSCFVLEENDKRLMVDCGGDARFSYGELGATNGNIGFWADGVYITHLHGDHINGLEWLAFCSYFNPQAPKPKLFIAEELLDPLFSSLRAGIQSLRDHVATLDTYFEVHPIKKQAFSWEGISFKLIQAHHAWNFNQIMPVYGLEFRGVYFSADTMISDDTLAACRKAEWIFHDCETYPTKSNFHAHYNDLKLLPETIKRKMWLYHYGPDPQQNPIKDGFLGFVKKGQQFDF